MQAVKQAVKTETAQQRPAGAQMALRILLSFIKIGAFTFGSGWSIVAQMEQEFVSEAEKLKSEGVVSEYYITNSNEDINKQISDMQDLITKKVDAIVITAASPTALAPVVEEATEAGIKVVSFDIKWYCRCSNRLLTLGRC